MSELDLRLLAAGGAAALAFCLWKQQQHLNKLEQQLQEKGQRPSGPSTIKPSSGTRGFKVVYHKTPEANGNVNFPL